MADDLTIPELEERIALVRQNINDLIEQAAARSGSADEDFAAERLAEQQRELDRLLALRNAKK